MTWIHAYHDLTDLIVRLCGGSDKLAHVHVGLAIYALAQVMLRTRRASWPALQLVVILELANEVLDAAYWGSVRWPDTIGDIVATMFWPATLYTLGRYRRTRWTMRHANRRAGEGATAMGDPSTAGQPTAA